jgi:acyl-CoA synthetase (AMP-forming)/AMP-acid ligase II
MYCESESIRNLSSLTKVKAVKNSDKIAVITGDGEVVITYKQLDEMVARVANGLRGLDVRKGDKVVILFPNSVEFLYVWFGVMRLGAVAVPLNISLKGPLLAYQINDSDAKIALVSRQLLQAYVDVKEKLRKVVYHVTDDDVGDFINLK